MAETITPPEIRVFAMFPLNSEFSNWDWHHCLTFPIATLNALHFAPKLYKWIRYATGVVIGAQGHLSFHLDTPDDVIDYDMDLPSESTNLYYHTTTAERARMFPVDPDMGHTTITSTGHSTQRVQFHGNVVERDGGVCVLTAFQEFFCDAAHLLAHSKGDEYIANYTWCHGRDSCDHVGKIDDVRNGILLNKTAHMALRQFVIAFLVTPNFAMSTVDIDPSASPTEKRCTGHLFDLHKQEAFGDSTIHSGCQVQMPDATNNWPPDILFDAVYAQAVLAHFASQTLQDMLKAWKSFFYSKGTTSAAQASYQAIIGDWAAQKARKNEQDQAWDQHAKRHSDNAGDGFDHFDLLINMPYIMMPQEEQEAVWRKAAEKRAEMEQSHVQDKVLSWAKDVADASL